MAEPNQHATEVWNQNSIPVILRRQKGKPLRMRLPYADTNRAWLQAGRRTKPIWMLDLKCWELPKAWFNDLANRSIFRFGAVWIIQPFHEREICAPACWNAKGFICECSCMGENHGAGNDGLWFEVSETFAFRWGPTQLACRLLTKKNIQVFQNPNLDA